MSDLRPRTRGRRLSGVARHGRLKRSRGWVVALKALATVVAVLAISSVSVAAIGVTQLTSFKKFDLVDGNGKPQAAPTVGAFEGGFNIMLSGSDTRKDQGGLGGADVGGAALNDVNILLHVSADHQHAVAVSIPRDLITDLPQCTDPTNGQVFPKTTGMFNSALARGGMACVVVTAEALTGLDIDYAGLITFKGVVDMTNALGGVNICVSGPITDRASGLSITQSQIQPDGTVNLVGRDALAFLRTRHGVGDGGDLSRINSQQVYMSALVRQLTSSGTLGDLGKMYGIARAAHDNIFLSSNLASLDTIVSMAQAVKGIDPADVTFVQFPVTDDPADKNRVVAIQAQATQLFQLIQADQSFTLGADALSGSGSRLAPGQTSAPAAAPATAAPAPVTTVPGTPVATPTPEPTLDVRGQTASQVTCSKSATTRR